MKLGVLYTTVSIAIRLALARSDPESAAAYIGNYGS